MSRLHTQALPVRVGTVGAAMRGSDASRRRAISSIRESAMAHLTLTDGAMAIAQASSDFAMLRATNSLSSMYSSKATKERGRRLPGSQLPAARARVNQKLAAKALRPRGYGKHHSVHGESDSDSDEGGAGQGVGQGGQAGRPGLRLRGSMLGAAERREAGEQRAASLRAAVGNGKARTPADDGETAALARQQGLTLPMGDASRFQWELPQTGAALVGWRVMAWFDGGWYDGVIVRHMRGASYAVFHEEDDEHEFWELPDAELVFMRESETDHCTDVSRDMLPRV